jgi:WD40 repeat protein
LASGSGEPGDPGKGRVELWDAARGKLRKTLAGHGGVVGSVAFSPDGKLLASGSQDKTAKVWDVAKELGQ